MEYNMIFAGFGGQGILLAGQIVAEAGMINGKDVTWMPSYGPEMRGGFARCSVIISDDTIGTPVISTPDVLVAMNQPSLDRFGPEVVSGGTIIYNSSLCKNAPTRDDVTIIPIACNELAISLGQPKVANMTIIGAVMEVTDFFNMDDMKPIVTERFGSKRPELIDINLQAIELGRKEIKK